MKKIGTVLAVVAALALAFPAEAQVSIDLKLGYAVPTGDIVTLGGATYSGPMSYTWSGAIPIEVAGRYRFGPSLSVGVYFQYDPAFVATRFCAPTMTCSAYDMRVGVEAVYGFLPERALNPWVSLGTGWEWTHFSVATADLSAAVTYSGWEYFNAQVGLDWNLSKTFAVGPYVGFFGGSYTSRSGSTTAGPEEGSIDSQFRTFHGWWQFGLKGTANL
jgi:hypothetical protein